MAWFRRLESGSKEDALPAKNKATFTKRERERQRQQQRQEKATKRQQRQAEKRERPPVESGGEDPDIAGIIPGPQPVQE